MCIVVSNQYVPVPASRKRCGSAKEVACHSWLSLACLVAQVNFRPFKGLLVSFNFVQLPIFKHPTFFNCTTSYRSRSLASQSLILTITSTLIIFFFASTPSVFDLHHQINKPKSPPWLPSSLAFSLPSLLSLPEGLQPLLLACLQL